MDKDHLIALLNNGLSFSPEYGNGLSNHLPMALYALHAMGASDARLDSFYTKYISRLEPKLDPTRHPIARTLQWQSALGDLDAYDGLFDAFQEILARDGIAKALGEIVPRLMPGVGAGAFHGLIRTAYAIEAGHIPEVAAGLAYWACRYLPLKQDVAASNLPSLTVGDWIGQLHDAMEGWTSDRNLIFARMQQVASSEKYQRIIGRIDVGIDTLKQLSDLAAELYRTNRNFTVLHLVTSCHALRLLLPYIDDPVDAIRWYAYAYGAGFISSGIALDKPVLSYQPLSWGVAIARAIESNDDHVIKLIYTCREQSAVYGGDLYLQMASLVANRPGS